MSNAATPAPELRETAKEVAYSETCESPGDFRFGMEQRHPEIAMDDIRTLWGMALAGSL